jgi:hypothetical protein
MSPDIERLKAKLSLLTMEERAELARFLNQSLDRVPDEEIESNRAVELSRRPSRSKKEKSRESRRRMYSPGSGRDIRETARNPIGNAGLATGSTASPMTDRISLTTEPIA